MTSSPAIPRFPEFREPILSDAGTFHSIASRMQPVISELTFTNIFVWRHTAGFQLSMIDDCLCILAHTEERPPFFLPPLGDGDHARVVMKMFDYLRDQGHRPLIERASEELVKEVVASVPQVTVEDDPDNADYIYLSSDLADLPGRKFHKKRNHIARFVDNYQFEYHRLTPDMVPSVIEFQEHWCRTRGCFSPAFPGLAREHAAVLEALENMETLNVVGGVITVEDKVAAFTMGEPLNKEAFVIHFEKANQDYQGCYQTVNQRFSADVCRDYKYVNREQDLGEPGLRQAKRSYYPDHLLMKYKLRFSD